MEVYKSIDFSRGVNEVDTSGWGTKLWSIVYLVYLALAGCKGTPSLNSMWVCVCPSVSQERGACGGGGADLYSLPPKRCFFYSYQGCYLRSGVQRTPVLVKPSSWWTAAWRCISFIRYRNAFSFLISIAAAKSPKTHSVLNFFSWWNLDIETVLSHKSVRKEKKGDFYFFFPPLFQMLRTRRSCPHVCHSAGGRCFCFLG